MREIFKFQKNDLMRVKVGEPFGKKEKPKAVPVALHKNKEYVKPERNEELIKPIVGETFGSKNDKLSDNESEGNNLRLLEASSEEIREVLEHAIIHGDKMNGRELTVADLIENFQEPFWFITMDGRRVYLAKHPYELPEGRKGITAYIESNQDEPKFIARSYYLSNSAASWRYLPGYRTNRNGRVTWYNKGYDEQSIGVPIALQKILSIIDEGTSFEEKLKDPEFILVGTARNDVGANDGSYFHQVKSEPVRLPGNFYLSAQEFNHDKISPQEVGLQDEDFSPDFNQLLDRWVQNSNLYGQVVMEVFPAKNGLLHYLFCRDKLGRVWISSAEDGSRITDNGLHQNWIDLGELATPAYEYVEQSGSYGNFELKEGLYVDMFKKYLSKVPIIQEYLQKRLIENDINKSIQ